MLKCVIIDRLEARLRKLDTMIAGARVRRLDGNEWAEQILATFPELRRQPVAGPVNGDSRTWA